MPTDPIAAVPAPPPPLPMPTAGSMFRQFVQLLVLVVSLLLVVRTVFVEPFGVPTGSMAPALLGNHRSAPCPNCDHPIQVGTREEFWVANPKKGPGNPQTCAVCPNCGHGPIDLTALSREILGDRLLVDKSAFTLRSPRRWEVAVFYTPDRTTNRTTRPRPFAVRAVGSPGEPYVKRVVGLPGETILIPNDGDIHANGVLCRKSSSQVWQTAVPVMTATAVPSATGWAPRWVAESVAPDTKPAGTASVEGAVLTLDAAATPDTAVALAYRHRNLKTSADEPVTDRLGYNGADRGQPASVHDFAVRCEIDVLAGRGTFSCELTDGYDAVKLELPVADATAEAGPARFVGAGFAPFPAANVRLVPGQKHRIEFAFVDRRATASLDGIELAGPMDLPQLAGKDRKPVPRPLKFAVRGASLAIHELILFRDIHYFASSTHAGFTPYRLKADEYFMLGDNANDSGDSRAWLDESGAANPGVPLGAFIGKPFLIHQPLRAGRMTVNGNDRQFTTVDWDRVRLLE